MQVKKAVRKKARIEIIPLIDVIMFLMAAFVLVMLSMNKNKQIRSNCPELNPVEPSIPMRPSPSPSRSTRLVTISGAVSASRSRICSSA